MKKIKLHISILAALLLGAFTALVPLQSAVFAQDAKQSICEGVGLAGGGGNDCNTRGGPTVEGVIQAAINLLSVVVGVVAVIMIIIGGLKYIMSNGDSNSINSAKNTILYAIIGLVIVAVAQVIVRFVMNRI